MIDDKELEARAKAFFAHVEKSEQDRTLLSDLKYGFIAGARSQDELAYQRGRREVLDKLEKRMDQTLLHFNHRATVDMLIEQLRTEGKNE